MNELIVMLMLVILGASLGSFLNVVEYRLPLMIAAQGTGQKLNLATPGSHCPGCKTPISWKHNIPIVSYTLLRGQCGTCKTKIPPQYLFNELAGAAAMAVPLTAFGLNGNGVILGLIALTAYVVVSTSLAAYQGYRKRQQPIA